jgi:uncharacterized protein YfiM (DUF2279 family)
VTPIEQDTYERMCEIVRLITSTQDKRAHVEYSALIAAAAMAMAASQGIAPTTDNLGRLGRLIARHVIPAIEAEAEQARSN